MDAIMTSFPVFTKNDTPSLGPSKSYTPVTTSHTIQS